ncbi:DUF397 domain-containing protein [Kibdelosporangium persicum]|uniref:DUF397 domain-containing protein n=1 Tax=Kibdelosporangium persicum TaxID=2698649 RepID=UPI0015641D25|nr:DUF397 domain-containing protein [Kibdelosporangium persicum]
MGRPATGTWKKSSRSGGQEGGGDCVEVCGDLWAVPDTKNPSEPICVDVRAFVNAVHSGALTRP